MQLNANKTQVVAFGTKRNQPECNVTLNDSPINQSTSMNLLGITIDSRLSFNDHVTNIVTKCNSKLYFLRKLKQAGVQKKGLSNFYLSCIRSVIVYSCPAWYSLLSLKNQEKLEKIQRRASKIIIPDIESYTERLKTLEWQELNKFMDHLCFKYFITIMSNEGHPLYDRLYFNNSTRTSARRPTIFKPPLSRTSLRANSFFIFYMNKYDEN
jgi:hypothetical protein